MIQSNGFVFRAFCIIAATAYVRLFWSIDLTDEALYIGDALLPWLGGKPFVHELYLQQSASLLYSPLVGLYHFLVPENLGLVLFVRHLYFFMTLATALHLRRFLTEQRLGSLAWALASVVIAFVPASIASLSYNTLGYLGFFNFLLWAESVATSASPRRSAAAGTAAVITIIAYPTLTIPLSVYVLLRSFIFLNQRTIRRLLPAVCFVTLFAVLFGLFTFQWGWDNLQRSYEFTRFFAAGDIHSLLETSVSIVSELFPPWWLSALFLVPIFIVPSRWLDRTVAAGLTVAWLVFVIFMYRGIDGVQANANFAHHFQMFYLALFIFAALLATRLLKMTELKSLPWIPIVSLLLAMLTLSLTSSNALFAAAYPAVILICFLFPHLNLGRRSRAIFPIVLAVSSLAFGYANFYRDKEIFALNTWISSGPFAGLWTNAQRADLLAEVAADLRNAPTAQTVLFYDSFPAGYLLSPKRPATLSLYMQILPFGAGARPLFASHYAQVENLPDLVFDFKVIELDDRGYFALNLPNQDPFQDPMKDFFKLSGRYDLVRTGFHYHVYRRRP